MSRLRKSDPVAYIRFATVYSDVKDLKELERLVKSFSGGNKK